MGGTTALAKEMTPAIRNLQINWHAWLVLLAVLAVPVGVWIYLGEKQAAYEERLHDEMLERGRRQFIEGMNSSGRPERSDENEW